MPQEDVFELTAAVTVVLEDSADSFEFVPTTFEPSEEPVEENFEIQQNEALTLEVALADGDFWCGSMTYFQILADPEYQAWMAHAELLQQIAAGDYTSLS